MRGARVDQDLVILSGLEAGETVVTDGQLRLAPGMKVQQRQGGGGPGGKRGPGGPPQGGETAADEGEKKGKRKSKE